MNNFSNFQFRSLFFVILLCVQIYIPLQSSQEVENEQSINFNDVKTFIVTNKYYIGITSASFLTVLILYLIKKQLKKNNISKNIHESTTNGIPDINKFEQLSSNEQRDLLITLIKKSKNYYQSKEIYCDFITEYYKGSKAQDKMISDYNDFEKKRIELEKTDSLPEGPLENQPLLLIFFQIYECGGVYQDIFVEYQLSKMCYELLYNKKELFAEESRDYHYVNLRAFFRTFSRIDTASDITMLFGILNNSFGSKFKVNLSYEYNNFPVRDKSSLDRNISCFEILFIFIKLMHVVYGNDIYNCLWKDQFIQLQDTIISYYLEYECSNLYLDTNFTIDIQEISEAITLFLQGEYELKTSVEEFLWKEIILERIIDIYRKIPQEDEIQLLKDLNLIQKFHVIQDDETIVINKNAPHIPTYEIFDLKTNQIVQESSFNIEYECKKLLHELILYSAKLNSKYNLEINTFYTEENVPEQQLINFIITLSEQCIENINNIHQETQKGIEQYSVTRYGTLQKYLNQNVYGYFRGEYYSQFRYLTEDNKQVFKIISQSILSPWIKVEWENSTNLPEYNAIYKPWECITFTEEKEQVYKELCDRLTPSSDLFINQSDDENELCDDLDRNINVLIYHEIQLPSNYIEKQMLQGMPFQEINS